MTVAAVELKQELVEMGRRAHAEGLLLSTCGNASIRVNEDSILISGSGTELGLLEACATAMVSIQSGQTIGEVHPSSEHPLHRYIYQTRPGIRVVLHYQSRAATVLACAEDPPTNLDLIPEIPAYVKKFAYVPYAAPGSDLLALNTARAFEDPLVNIVQMENHGQVVVALSPAAAIQKALFFELAAWMHLQNPGLRRIPEADANALRNMKSV